MFEDRRKLVIGGLIALFIIIVALILWWLLGNRPAQVTVAPPVQPPAGEAAIVASTVLPPPTPERTAEDTSYPLGLKQLAMSFAERYGSYSSDEPTKNLRDLTVYMTARLQADPATNPVLTDSGSFSGYSTRALSSQLVKLDANSATIVVKTQRTQTLDSSGTVKNFYADLQLQAIKAGNEWKIDAVKWL